MAHQLLISAEGAKQAALCNSSFPFACIAGLCNWVITKDNSATLHAGFQQLSPLNALHPMHALHAYNFRPSSKQRMKKSQGRSKLHSIYCPIFSGDFPISPNNNTFNISNLQPIEFPLPGFVAFINEVIYVSK